MRAINYLGGRCAFSQPSGAVLSRHPSGFIFAAAVLQRQLGGGWAPEWTRVARKDHEQRLSADEWVALDCDMHGRTRALGGLNRIIVNVAASPRELMVRAVAPLVDALCTPEHAAAWRLGSIPEGELRAYQSLAEAERGGGDTSQQEGDQYPA